MDSDPPYCSKDNWERGCRCPWCVTREAAVIARVQSNSIHNAAPTPPPVWPSSPNGGVSYGPFGWVTVPAPAEDTQPTIILPPEARAEDPNRKLPPMKCRKCDYINEYVGKEHLDYKGRYTCRSCKKYGHL